ncbi:MAG: 2-oxoacid:acceptor oxidoreductase family protein [Limnochordia bacterium]|jgi:pyruvate ferredoxin oxidoreductase gamma subunit
MLEVRWHGRGGQGAKTAALLLGEAAAAAGKKIQAFPEYGPERMGAPVTSYNRISDGEITLHCGVTNPNFVVVLDGSLINTGNVTEGMASDGVIVVNSSQSPEEIREKLGLGPESQVRVYTVDANTIAQETIGRAIPNTPMLGALIRTTGVLELDELLRDTQEKLEKKFRDKPEIVQGNLAAIRRAYDEVRGDGQGSQLPHQKEGSANG